LRGEKKYGKGQEEERIKDIKDESEKKKNKNENLLCLFVG